MDLLFCVRGRSDPKREQVENDHNQMSISDLSYIFGNRPPPSHCLPEIHELQVPCSASTIASHHTKTNKTTTSHCGQKHRGRPVSDLQRGHKIENKNTCQLNNAPRPKSPGYLQTGGGFAVDLTPPPEYFAELFQ